MKYKNIAVLVGIFFFTYTACNCDNKKTQLSSLIHPYNSLAYPQFNFTDFQKLKKYEVDSNTTNILAHFYQYFWEGNDLWGEFLVAQGNQILYEGYRGFANYQDSTLITRHTPMHLASISKNLTSMVILKLVEKKKLKLHQRVNSVLTKFPYTDITIFDLLTHRSGLGNYDYYAEEFQYVGPESPDFTNERMYDMYAQCQPGLIFKPGTQHSYCNANYAFLALVIEKITGLSYPEAMKELLFYPLEMNDTYVFQKQNMDTATLSYYYNKKPWKWDYFDLIYGDKNIYSTAEDLFKYSRAMFSNNFLPKSLMDSAMTGYSYERKGVKNYGLGFRLREFDNGKKVVFHTGKWHGNNTLFMHLPDEQLTIISLGNRQNRANYAAFSLVSLFGDYPLELESEDELLANNNNEDQMKIDSLTHDAKEIWNKVTEQQITHKKKDTVKVATKPKIDTSVLKIRHLKLPINKPVIKKKKPKDSVTKKEPDNYKFNE